MLLRRRAVFALILVLNVLIASAAFASFTASRSTTQSVSTGVLAAPANPAAVRGLCVNNTYNIVDLSWTASASTFADGYEVYRATAATGPWTLLATVNGRATTTYQDQNTLWNTTLFYQVQSTRNLWRSPVSATVQVLTPRRNCT